MHLPKLMLLISGLFLFHFHGVTEAEAQTHYTEKRYIEVSGNANLQVIPDEIYLNITLREFMKDNKTKVTTDDLEKQLSKAMKNADLPVDSLKVDKVSASLQTYKKRKDKEVFASKTFILHTTELDKIADFLAEISETDISYLYIQKLTHTQIEELELQVKVDALKNAKTKAEALLNGLDEELGKVLSISETGSSYHNYDIVTVSGGKRKTSFETDFVNDIPQQFKPIELSYSIEARFEIK